MEHSGYTLPVTLELTHFQVLRMEAASKDITVNDVVKAIVRAYIAQQCHGFLEHITLPEIVVMLQSGEIDV